MKKIFKVATVVGVGIAIVATEQVVEGLIRLKREEKKEEEEQKEVDEAEEASNEALYRFNKTNKLGCGDFVKVNENKIPTFAYDSGKLNMEEMKAPKGYILVKMKSDTGAEKYALMKILKDKVYFYGNILVLFIDKNH